MTFVINPYRFGSAAPLTYNQTVLAKSPVWVMPLDDASGATAVALVGPDGAYNNAPTLRVAGPSAKIPYGVTFNGTNQSVSTGTSATLPKNADATYEVWAKWTTTTITICTLVVRDPTGTAVDSEALLLANRTSAGQMTLFRGSTNEVIAGSSLNNGAWHHIVGVHDVGANVSRLYIDGALVGSGTVAAAGGIADRRALLATNNGAIQMFPGSLAAAAVYPSAFSAAQVAENYAAGTT